MLIGHRNRFSTSTFSVLMDRNELKVSHDDIARFTRISFMKSKLALAQSILKYHIVMKSINRILLLQQVDDLLTKTKIHNLSQNETKYDQN